MPSRKIVLQNDFYYHVFNRGVEKRNIFLDTREYQHALQAVRYYQFNELPLRFSKFLTLELKQRDTLMEKIEDPANLLVNIVAYCLMPNHYHFLLQQVSDKGIQKFVANFSNSYTKYFNIRHDRTGHLFQGKFKAVAINDDDQITHLSRYIHLNPVTSSIVTPAKLLEYRWSSYNQYVDPKSFNYEVRVKPEIVLDQFKYLEDFRSFTADYAQYQQELYKLAEDNEFSD